MSKTITIKQAREYYELGAVTAFHLVRDPLASGQWMLVLEGRAGSWTLQTARGEVRSFTTLDAAVRSVEEIGMPVTALGVGV